MRPIETERGRDYFGKVTNTDIWRDFALRADDVIVTTPPKCGTTWTLNIVMMLIRGKVVPDAGNRETAPWLDSAFRDRPAIARFLDGLERWRCIKSHTPMDGIPYATEPTYIVVYRHPADVHFSFRSHAENMKENTLVHMFPPNERVVFLNFVGGAMSEEDADLLTLASLVNHYAQAKARAAGGNVHFFHYTDMSRDLRGQIARLAKIMNVTLSPQLLDDLSEANTFASMRHVVEQSETRFHESSPFRDQASFFNSGTSNKWKGRLSDADLEQFEARIAALLPPEDAAWLCWGDTGQA